MLERMIFSILFVFVYLYKVEFIIYRNCFLGLNLKVLNIKNGQFFGKDVNFDMIFSAVLGFE